MRADTTSKVYFLKALNSEKHISLACEIIDRHFDMPKMYPCTDCCRVAGDVVHQRLKPPSHRLRLTWDLHESDITTINISMKLDMLADLISCPPCCVIKKRFDVRFNEALVYSMCYIASLPVEFESYFWTPSNRIPI